MKEEGFRVETDTLGEVKVRADAYWGAQTQRAIENFPISGWKIPIPVIRAIAAIKWAAAKANAELGLIPGEFLKPIQQACLEIWEGKLNEHFPIDVFQTGSGTSTNMNVNEVIATRANEIITGKKNTKHPIHPNDIVNKCQSSNDVIPSAIMVATVIEVKSSLLPSLKALEQSLLKKSEEFKDIVKIGRTHLMDATPITLGQEFSGYAYQVKNAMEMLSELKRQRMLALGGTAVGTGINAHPLFAQKAIKYLNELTGEDFYESPNHFFSQATIDTLCEFSGRLQTFATSLFKIANDLRWLSSGPKCGVGEITLPSLQPGSSIMPGKINPVIPEAVMMVCCFVMGLHTTIAIAAQNGNFELNTMLPVSAYSIINEIQLLSNASHLLATKCIDGIKPNKERIKEMVEWSMSLVTPLALHIGYDKAAELAKRAVAENKTVRQLVKELNILPPDQIDKILDPMSMTHPSAEIIGSGGG